MSRLDDPDATAAPWTAAAVEGLPPLVRFSRRKPRRLGIALPSRLYASARRVLPARWLCRALLDWGWLINRFAVEQVWYALGPVEAMRLLRPHALEFVRSSIPPLASVIDIGGGFGFVSHAAAGIAASVLYVDHSEYNLQRARETCQADPNVEFVSGDGLAILGERGPFDVALLLHVLEHLDEPREALGVLRRHCGLVVIEVPDFGSNPLNFVRLREELPCYSDADHITEFSPEYLTECLRASAWKVRDMRVCNGVILAVAEAS